ncbi:hypothetical protein SAMN05421890_4917 [Ensifer adhaerens]|nr:hypothetical protein SAMN05421890_4917 [Ensifer adhaerens]
MPDILRSMWDDINAACFAGELTPPADISWQETGGENGIGAHGVYLPKPNAIAIDERFRPDIAAVKAKDPKEIGKLEIVYRLVIHEMIHQALHQRNAPTPGGHGASFCSEAERVAKLLAASGIEVVTPTLDNAKYWPFGTDRTETGL